jgi:uncharacterized lipoprotein YddW (UPF0748 family)
MPPLQLNPLLLATASSLFTLASGDHLPPQTLGTWIPTYGDEETNPLQNETAAAANLAKLAAAGTNTVYIDAWHGGITTFPSKTWSVAAGNVSWNGTDYLSFPVTIAKSLGLRVIAWFEYGLMYDGVLQEAQPSWFVGESNGFAFMNASNPNVADFMVGITLDALKHQPLLDGVQFDDHFAWPSTLSRDVSPQVKQNTLTQLLSRLRSSVHESFPSSFFSMAPNPADSALADQNADWPLWLKLNLCDDIIVQLYCYDADYFIYRMNEQFAALPSPNLASKLKTGILLNNGNVSNINATAMMRAELTAATNPSTSFGGQVLWYARGILLYSYDAVKEIWTNVSRSSSPLI